MSYTQDNVLQTVIGATAEDLTATGAVYTAGEIVFDRQVRVKRLMFLVTTTVAADATAPQVEFNKRVTPKSATAEVLLGTLIIPDGTAAGTRIYKDIDPVVIGPGESISFEHTVQAADGSSATGAGYYLVEVDPDPEYVANQADMVASA